MFEGKHIQVGAGRYIQCHGALKRAGEEMVFFGKKAYLLYGDDLVKGKTSQVLEESLRESGITFQSEIWQMPVSLPYPHPQPHVRPTLFCMWYTARMAMWTTAVS